MHPTESLQMCMTLKSLNNMHGAPVFTINIRPPLSQIMHDFTAGFPTLLGSETCRFPLRPMHKDPSTACAPVLKHISRLQQMVQSYPTVSTTSRSTVQWAICLQAAMTTAHSSALSFRPKMVMDPKSCAYPGGKVICVNHQSMDWNPMDFVFINILFPPKLSNKSFDDFLTKVRQQLDLNGYPAPGP